MLINTQYEADFGVRFLLVNPATGEQIGAPRIAKVGSPLTAFVSCQGDDTPDSGLGIGDSFLTDDGVLGNSADLLVEYLSPVRQASGVILDIDARSSTPGAVEGWLIRAISTSGDVLESIQLIAPQGPDEPGCEGFNGEGDGSARGFSFSRPNADIAKIQFTYIGNADLGSVGLAFDNFSPSTAVEELQIEISFEFQGDICGGTKAIMSAQTSGGFSDQTIRWESRVDADSPWQDANVSSTDGEYYPRDGEQIRAIVDDGSVEVASELIEFELPNRVVNFVSGSVNIANAAIILFDSIDAEEVWGDDPTTFNNDEIETVSEGVHVLPMITQNGAHLAVIYNTTGGTTPGTATTEVITEGFEPVFIFRDDPDDPMYNDTYTEETLGPGMKRFTLDQTWAGDKTDGFIIGPMIESGTYTITITKTSGLSTGLCFQGDGDPIPFTFKDGMQIVVGNSCGAACPVDLNGDGTLNFFDVSAFLVAFQASDPVADLTGDGMFNFFDVSAFLVGFNAGCP